MPTSRIRRVWAVHCDDRSNEVGWTLGSKVWRSRVEEGKFGSAFHYDFCIPYMENRPMTDWSWGLPQMWRGQPRDGKLLHLRAPNGDQLILDFFYEPTGIPGSLLAELMHNLTLIPVEEMEHEQGGLPQATVVAPFANSQRRKGVAR